MLDAATIKEEQQTDAELQHLLDSPQRPLHRLSIEDNVLYCEISSGVVRSYIPVSLRRAAFNVVHGLSHPSGRSTSRLLPQKFFLPGLKKDAAKWSRECEPCHAPTATSDARHDKSILPYYNCNIKYS